MPASGVADHDDSVKVEVDASDAKLREVLDASGDIVHRCRPSGLRRSQPTVFHVPDGETAARQIVGHGGHLIAAMGHPPKPAVQQASNGRPWRCGKVQVRYLIDGRPIWDCLYRRTSSGHLASAGVDGPAGVGCIPRSRLTITSPSPSPFASLASLI
jgi:hypothetical protein